MNQQEENLKNPPTTPQPVKAKRREYGKAYEKTKKPLSFIDHFEIYLAILGIALTIGIYGITRIDQLEGEVLSRHEAIEKLRDEQNSEIEKLRDAIGLCEARESSLTSELRIYQDSLNGCRLSQKK